MFVYQYRNSIWTFLLLLFYFIRSELKIKILLVLVNWLLCHCSRRSSYLPQWSQDCFSLWPKWIITVECGILTIKETSVKTLQSGLYSVILNLSIKNMYNKKKKKFDWKKNNIPSSQLYFKCNIEIAKITIFYVNFLFLEILVNVFLIYFICEYMSLS